MFAVHSCLSKFPRNQRSEGRHRLLGIDTFRTNRQSTPLRAIESKNTEDASPVDLDSIFLQRNLSPEAIGRFDQLSGYPGMDPQPVCDFERSYYNHIMRLSDSPFFGVLAICRFLFI
jgi:hypothetical protein